jgi:L-lysine 6-transaminase
MASFVDAFGTVVTPPQFRYHFWISGGALAVENAMKVAFDWKARKLGRTGMQENVDDLVILHFRQAFHGRSGYTMSVTNTLPDKVGLFPRFSNWPRVHNPFVEIDADGTVTNDIEAEEARACAEIEAAFAYHGRRIAGILIEPMQGEGGDNHFRPSFLQKLRDYANDHEALLLFDEVQTGFYGSGKPWLWQHYGVEPDVVAFGKKSQVCGIYAGPRLDEVEDHVFVRSSRINSTWGGSLTDMVRSRRFIEIIQAENLTENITARGDQLLAGLRALAREHGTFSNVRGIGTLVAVSLATPVARDQLVSACYAQELLLLSCGTRSLRFRLPFVITAEEVDTALERLAAAASLPAVTAAIGAP